MKGLHAALSALLLLLFAVSSRGADLEEESLTEVVVGVNHAPPYRDLEQTRPTGLYIDIFQAVAQRMGWSPEFREAPFRRILQMAEQGSVDILLGPQRTESRSRSLAFVAPLFPAEDKLFFYIHPEHEVRQYEDLYEKRIGVLEGASYFPRFDQDSRLTRESAPRYENLMLMLGKDRVDVVVAPEMVGAYALELAGIEARVSPFEGSGRPSYLVVSRRSPLIEQSDRIRQVVDELEEEGVIKRMIQQYQQQAHTALAR